MSVKHHLSSFFLLLILLISSVNAHAQSTNIATTQTADETQADIAWIQSFRNEMWLISLEYRYYGDKYDDSSKFPQAREQELLHHFENSYLNTARYQRTVHNAEVNKYSPLHLIPNIRFAQLFFRYGADSLYKIYGKTPVEDIVLRWGDRTKKVPKLSHDKIIAIIKDPEIHGYETEPWNLLLATPDTIELTKLFLGMGADMDFSKSIRQSLCVYERDERDTAEAINPEAHYRYPDEIHRADDIIAPHYDDFETYYKYYRTPVTYWLEEFVAKDYPISMLDTHKLHYLSFMKEARVAEITAMLNNPEAHKIPANINCPYKETCPLVPSINMRDAMGRTPLHIAGLSGNIIIFNTLINMGADTSIKDYQGKLAIRPMLRGKALEKAKQKVKLIADLRNKSEHPLWNYYFMKTATAQDIEPLLQEPGININRQDKYKKTPLFQAGITSNVIAFDILLEAGASYNNDADDDVRAKIWLYNDKQIAQIRAVAKARAQAEQAGIHPLLYEDFMKHSINVIATQIEELLVNLASDDEIHMKDAMGRTPLHIAGELGNNIAFLTLLENAADRTIKDSRGNAAELK